jgi:SAM-dependent methyltransferase
MTESYTSGLLGLGPRLRQARGLLNLHGSRRQARVDELIHRVDECRASLQHAFGFEVRGKDVLDVGPGQFLIQSRYFALENKVVALDSEVILDRFSLRGFVDMVRCNGLQRAIKTVARMGAGIDRLYAVELRQRLGVGALPAVELRRGDACQMPCADNSFDMVYCRAVLHHLDDPAAALMEMRRVLKPAGVAWVDLHLYSSWNGSLDPRVMFGRDPKFHWAHLRHGASGVVEGAHLNKLRLADWRELFSRSWPGVQLQLIEVQDPALQLSADQLISERRVTGYSKEELLTTTVVALWQKRA